MCGKYLPLQETLIKEKALHQQVDRHVLEENVLNKIVNKYAPVSILNTENFINVANSILLMLMTTLWFWFSG